MGDAVNSITESRRLEEGHIQIWMSTLSCQEKRRAWNMSKHTITVGTPSSFHKAVKKGHGVL